MRRALLVSACLFLAHAAAPRHLSAVPSATEAQLKQVDRWLAKGETHKAERALQRALKRSPDLALAQRYAELSLPLRAPSAEDLPAKRRAATLLLRTLERSKGQPWPENLPPHAALAHALVGQRDAALELADSAGDAPREAWAESLRAIAALALDAGASETAEAALARARTRSPEDPAILAELGLLALARGDPAAAVAALSQRFALERSSLSARRDLAYALSAAGEPDQGYRLLSADRAACAQAELCLIELSRWALEARELDSALREAQAALERAVEPVPALYLLAEVHVARGELKQARARYERILAIDPEQLRARAAREALEPRP